MTGNGNVLSFVIDDLIIVVTLPYSEKHSLSWMRIVISFASFGLISGR